MKLSQDSIYLGKTPWKASEQTVRGESVEMLGETWYKIQNFDAMEPFFISLVSSSDHWLFIASTGGLTAGRGSAEQALFPYYTVDKITENSENTGNKAILLVRRGARTSLWEPLSSRTQGNYALERNLYKNAPGTALVFEEINLDLGLTYRYAWRTSEKFGFVKTTWLANTGKTGCRVDVLDGLQNILPANVSSTTQNIFSSLLDAYKRSELHPETGLGIFALNSTLTDLAEPSESLLATTVAQVGLDRPTCLLSSGQLERFRSGKGITAETEVRGQRGAYFCRAQVELAAGEERCWHLLADVQQDHAAIIQKIRWLRGERSAQLGEIEEDVAANQQSLVRIVASADGLQNSGKRLYPSFHFANVLFNVMRGGLFTDGYWINAGDFREFVSVRNTLLAQAHADFFAALPGRIHIADLKARAEASGSIDLVRLSYAYLPLTFSRRHGDPSRPWNRFAIRLKKPDGSLNLDYEGNWRDIFQNWEALAYSYPEYVESMIATFLNATTVDGYNPYRITRQGVDWEIPEPGNPWANIGYWSDHQVVYLQKLLEISAGLHPNRLQEFLARPMFSYANVPYKIKPYAELLQDAYNTIDFDWDQERLIEKRVKERGTDGKLVLGPGGQILHASLAEKLLTLLLAKLVNFVPEGGIWMNTQRPEWNDANNALVGKGLSVVTLCYLRRMLAFCQDLFGTSQARVMPVSREVALLARKVMAILSQHQDILRGAFSDEQRRAMMDELGEEGSTFRWNFYRNGLSGEREDVAVEEILAFLALAQQYVEHSLRANRRSDALYHSYNTLRLEPARAAIGHLYEMLEGQVAILSSGMLDGDESLALLQSLRHSSMYVAEQHSYLLYPDRPVAGFLEKNCLPVEQVKGVALFQALLEAGDSSLLVRDIEGGYHFNGNLHNYRDVSRVLRALGSQERFASLVAADSEKIKALFEATFHHSEFTGRSGTFFAYEGLGSIYWHMVAKLLLAVQETALRFPREPFARALRERYADIRLGLSFNKPADRYGAFPTDPYSHTPKGQGAKQPGMTGMVKELILTRQGELGIAVKGGRLMFDPQLLDVSELLASPSTFTWLDVDGQMQTIALGAGSLAFSICQTPVVLKAEAEAGIRVHFRDGSEQQVGGKALDEAASRHIFERDGVVRMVSVAFRPGG